tara:strand:- start:7093 stop:7743 length:651 start_codon:yes stop_codon:yes gene_type:complete
MTEEFELSIPSHIEFILYKFDSIDSQIISKVKRECTNFSIDKNKNHYMVTVDDFIDAINTSPRLKAEIEKWSINSTDANVNSVYFLVDIMNRLTNLQWISFKISTSKNFTRLIKYDDSELVSFRFNIIEGQFDLSKLMERKDLDQFNRKCIEIGIMENKYLNRRPYFYMTALVLMETLVLMDMEGNYKSKKILDLIDPKLETDNPMLLVKTDYTSY